MGTGTLVTLLIALLIGMGLKTIIRDWRAKFAQDDQAAEARKQAQIARNKAEIKSVGVVELERGEDGVYRPRSDNS